MTYLPNPNDHHLSAEILSPNPRRDIEHYFLTKSDILGYLIFFEDFFLSEILLNWLPLSKTVRTMKNVTFQNGQRVPTSNQISVIMVISS